MTKVQTLSEAKAHSKYSVNSIAGASGCGLRSFGEARLLKEHFNNLEPDERRLIVIHVKAALKRERRRAAARTSNYDLSRHIGLFLALKEIQIDKR